MNKLPEFKIACHALSEIMAGEVGLTEKQEQTLNEYLQRKSGVGKPLTPNMEAELEKLLEKRDHPELPAGAKTYCKKWLKRKLFNRSEDWKNIVVDKGLACENDSIRLVSEICGEEYEKNEDFLSNDYCHGEPDILKTKIVRDIKSSWDLFTFPMFDDEIPKKDYWWQLQGYMWLTGLEKAALDYTLIDTPMPLVLLDLKKLYYQSGGVAEEWSPEKYEALYPNYRFDDVPKEMRVKSFYFDFEPWVVPQITARVQMCREYIQTLIKLPHE
jgi:hypothetical protein